MRVSADYIFGFLAIAATIIVTFYVNDPWITSGMILAAGCFCGYKKYSFQKNLEKKTKFHGRGLMALDDMLNEFKHMKDGMHEASILITDLGKEGEREFKQLSEEDELSQALLKADLEIKKYNEEEQKRNWRVEGLAKFSELLRSHDKDLSQLSDDIIKHLCRYVQANQGAIFIHQSDENDEYLLMTACYAYNKKRIREKRVEIGQGLIGQCFLEKETIYLTEVPEGYVNITSGLGEATANNLVMLPLIINDRVYGVLELAAFKPLEKYKVHFLELLSEHIASVFSSVDTNERTKKLLNESQQLAQSLKVREEEMRQNMEELTATQEEMSRKQSELDGVVTAISNVMGIAELDTQGRFISANDMLKGFMGVEDLELRNKDYKNLIGMEDANADFLNRILADHLQASHYQLTAKRGRVKWLSISFSPIRDQNGNTNKILALVRDVTKRKLQEMEFEKLSLVADNTDNAVIIMDKDGVIDYVNRGYCDMSGYSMEEVIGKTSSEIVYDEANNQEAIIRLRENLEQKKPAYEEIMNFTHQGDSYWISMAINPVLDNEGNVTRYIAIQADITETKKRSLDFSYKLQAISKSNAIVELSPEGVLLDVNENFLKIFEYQKEDVIGQHHRMLVKKEERQSEEYKEFWATLRTGKFIEGEFQRIKRDGRVVWLKGIYNPIYNIKGELYKIVKFVTDITQQKLLEVEKQRQEIELEYQMEAINKTIAAVEFDLNGYIKKSNDIFNSITGIDLEKTPRLHYSDIIPPTDILKPQTELMWNNLRDGKFFSGEFKFMDDQRKELWLIGTFNPIKDIEGHPYKIMMYAQFNTQEKEKQKDLMGTVNALKNTTPILELNPDLTFKTGNQLFFADFGYKRLELRKKPFIEFLSHESKSEFQKIKSNVLTQDFVECNFIYEYSDGKTHPYRTTFSTIFDLEEKMYKVVVIMIDRVVVEKV